MASWTDWFDPRKSGAILDEAYKNSTLRGGNIRRQLELINRLDEQHDKDRGIEVHTIPRDTRNRSPKIKKEESNANKINKIITTPTTITEEQMQLKSQEGVSRTAEIMKNDSRFDAGRAAIKKDPSLALQKEGEPNLGWSTVFHTVDADGQPQVLTGSQRRAWEMKNQDLAPKPEPPSAVNPNGDPSNFNKDTGPWKGNAKSFAEIPKGLDLSGKQFSGAFKPDTDISQASAKAFDGTVEGTQTGMNTIAAIAGGLNKLLNKPKEKGVVIPDLHESKDVQLVAAANPWDEFANLMG